MQRMLQTILFLPWTLPHHIKAVGRAADELLQDLEDGKGIPW